MIFFIVLSTEAKVMFCPYNMGRDAERYPEPLAFRPERWIPFQPLGRLEDRYVKGPSTPQTLLGSYCKIEGGTPRLRVLLDLRSSAGMN